MGASILSSEHPILQVGILYSYMHIWNWSSPILFLVKSSEIFSTNSQQKVSPYPDICDVGLSPVIHMLYSFILHIGTTSRWVLISQCILYFCSGIPLLCSPIYEISIFLPLIYCFSSLDVSALWKELNTNTDINIILWHSLYSSVFSERHLNEWLHIVQRKRLENLSEETGCYTTTFLRVSHSNH